MAHQTQGGLDSHQLDILDSQQLHKNSTTSIIRPFCGCGSFEYNYRHEY